MTEGDFIPDHPSAYDRTGNGRRVIVQATEDGYYGWAFVGELCVAAMVGPTKSVAGCLHRLERGSPPLEAA